MPTCHRCGRLQPTGELRRTSLGFVCLEGGELGKSSRCLRLAAERRAVERELACELRRATPRATA